MPRLYPPTYSDMRINIVCNKRRWKRDIGPANELIKAIDAIETDRNERCY